MRKNIVIGRNNQKGFSLLELMIAMFIMIILLSVAVPTYQRSVQHARELVLKENLWQMRRAIDQYTADKGKMPKSIEDLVGAKYLHEKPIDPIRTAKQNIAGTAIGFHCRIEQRMHASLDFKKERRRRIV